MSGGWRMAKRVGEMALNRGGGAINWFPGHMAAATRAIRERLKLADLVVEVRDARIPLSSVNEDLQSVLSHKRRVIALNKKDLANPNIMNRCLVQWEPRDLTENYYPHRNGVTLLPLLQAACMPGICLTASALAELKWVQHFDSWKQDCLSINAHRKNSVTKLLALVELKLKEVILRQPTLLVMVVGVPNVGKSTLINSIHQIAAARFPVQEKMKRATVGPSPGVTQDIAGYKIAHEPSIYVLDTPGILVPSIPDIETGLKLALTGAVKDSVVGEERLAQYLLAVLNTRSTPLHWKHLDNKHEEIPRDSLPRKGDTDARYIEDLVAEVRRALFTTFEEFEGDLEDDNCLESLIENQFLALQKAFRISSKSSEARCMVSKKLLALFRIGKLGPFTLDVVPSTSNP